MSNIGKIQLAPIIDEMIEYFENEKAGWEELDEEAEVSKYNKFITYLKEHENK